jgi:GTPase SAR1 family protein
MENRVILYFVGTAGSGKSTLTHTFSQWMIRQGYNPIIINLDPGVLKIPYVPDIDIRDWIVLSEVMEEYQLGPNGAQIACADMIALHIQEVADVLEGFKADYVLIDTPGQDELFAFRSSSRAVIEHLNRQESSIAFLFDPMLTKRPSGFVSSLMLSATVQFRLMLPIINVLSKTDLLEENERDTIVEWSQEPYKLIDAVREEVEVSSESLLSIEFFKSLENIEALKSLTPVSVVENYGIEDIYNQVQQVFMGGEDLD